MLRTVVAAVDEEVVVVAAVVDEATVLALAFQPLNAGVVAAVAFGAVVDDRTCIVVAVVAGDVVVVAAAGGVVVVAAVVVDEEAALAVVVDKPGPFEPVAAAVVVGNDGYLNSMSYGRVVHKMLLKELFVVAFVAVLAASTGVVAKAVVVIHVILAFLLFWHFLKTRTFFGL